MVSSANGMSDNSEIVMLFPGWAQILQEMTVNIGEE
jgi:hypothetical protein